MSDFEYSSLSSDSDEEIVTYKKAKNNIDCNNLLKIPRELRLYYSRLFIDTTRLIDLFVKSKRLTFDSFLDVFDLTNFHQIYAKVGTGLKQLNLSPHHYITTTQDALGVVSKFLCSRSREARIGTVYLLYVLYMTQPLLITYPISIKMRPQDFKATQELVNECLNEGLAHPAYCFYELNMKKNITITATTVDVCLEVNYPRAVVRKHLGRVADKQFQTVYEERKEFDPISKVQLMEQQMRNELTYINMLSNLTLGHNAAPEYKPALSETLIEVNAVKNVNVNKRQSSNQDASKLKKPRYKNKKSVAFPGKNESILEDMVITPPEVLKQKAPIKNACHPRKKLTKTKKRKRICANEYNNNVKQEPGCSSSLTKSADADSDSFASSVDSDDCADAEDKYGDMIWRLLEGQEDDDEIPTDRLPKTEKNSD